MRKIVSKCLLIGALSIMSMRSAMAQEPVASLSEYPTLIMLVTQAGDAVSAYDTLVNAGVLMNNTLGGVRKTMSPVLLAAGRLSGNNFDILQKMPTSVKGLALANMSPAQASSAMTGLLVLDKTVSYTDSKVKEIKRNRREAVNDTAISSMAYALGNEAAIKKEQEVDGLVAQSLGNATDMQALFRTLTAVDRQTLAVSLQEASIEATAGAVKAMRAMDNSEDNSGVATEEASALDKALSMTGDGLSAVGGATTTGLNAISGTMAGVAGGIGAAVQGTQNAVNKGSKAASDWVVDSLSSSDEKNAANTKEGGAS